MQWSPQQDKALKEVAKWLQESDDQVFRLFGYAGTGKTTLAKHLAQDVPRGVLFGAFTGKAAYVLQQKGCPASTIHSMIYHTSEKSKARLKELEIDLFALKREYAAAGLSEAEIQARPDVIKYNNSIREEKKSSSRPNFTLNTASPVRDVGLIVIDECSMVDERMGEDLLSFGTKVLVLGDPAQLPPVGGAGYFTENVKPNIMLDEIHRQAQDNPIISLATQVRQGKFPSLGQYGSSKIITQDRVNRQEVLDADQIIVGKNNTRTNYNHRMRKLLGRDSEFPLSGDKIVCLRNNQEIGLLNGALWEVLQVLSCDEDRIEMVIKNENGTVLEVESHVHHFLGKGSDIPWYERKEAEEFDYGYALTCHKSQGSQWDDVFVFDESLCFRKHRERWLYTAITRAAEKITIVKM